MDRVIITLGDFLKNAGIVGMKYLLDISEAEEDSDYGITSDEQGIWLDRDFALHADWTDLYFNACVKYFGKNTVYQGVLDRIERCLTKIREDKWNPGREEKDDLKFITEKLLSNSYQNGFNIIKEKVENPEVYLELKGLIDTAKEKEKIAKNKAALEKDIARTSGKLANKGFLAKAPEAVVEKEKEKLAQFEEKMKSLEERLKFLDQL